MGTSHEQDPYRPPCRAGRRRRRLASPAVLRAQKRDRPIKLATLTPLTGAGGSYGPVMAKVAASVVEEVNKAGGVLGSAGRAGRARTTRPVPKPACAPRAS